MKCLIINSVPFWTGGMHRLWLALLLILTVAGCGTAPRSMPDVNTKSAASAPIVLHEGDSIRISFPGAPSFNGVRTIRRDGKIAIEPAGEITAAGLTPAELQKKLEAAVADKLLEKEVVVNVESSTFTYFVTGAVLRPGKYSSDRPITALDAIMEAGGPDYARANLKAVKVLRNTSGKMETYKLDLKKVLSGGGEQTFYLQPNDIVSVPERFTMF